MPKKKKNLNPNLCFSDQHSNLPRRRSLLSPLSSLTSPPSHFLSLTLCPLSHTTEPSPSLRSHIKPEIFPHNTGKAHSSLSHLWIYFFLSEISTLIRFQIISVLWKTWFLIEFKLYWYTSEWEYLFKLYWYTSECEYWFKLYWYTSKCQRKSDYLTLCHCFITI